ncbi:lamin tail domain-containing protein [Labilibaculum euxinus]
MKKTLSIKLFLLLFLLNSNCLYADDIWKIDFTSDIGKGYWGSNSDLTGITDWSLDVSNCSLSDDEDYAMVVGTKGGRFEARDCDGEAVWKSRSVDISGFTDVAISVLLAETGSSTSSSKYAKVFYKLDGADEVQFELNGENSGNWGSVNATQADLNGSSLEIVVRMNNPNSTNLVYFDNLVVSGNLVVPETEDLTQIKASDNPVESKLLSTNCNEKEKALTCFRFVIDETAEAADGLPTKISRMIFYNSKPDNGMNWKDCLGGLCLFVNNEEIIPQNFIIESDSILMDFEENQISIPDAEKMEFELRCYLNSDHPLTDGETFQLYCKDSAKGFETFVSGSGFNPANEELLSAIHSVEVEATRMIFSDCPDTLIRNSDFSILVNAVDDFNNRDFDANQMVILSLETGTGNLESLNGFQNSFVKGEVSFESLKYSHPEFIKLAVSNDVLPKTISENIRVENTYESFVNVNDSYSSDSIISSLRIREVDAFEVFRFSVTDSGNDNASTILEQIRLIGSEKNQVNWKKSIEKFFVKVEGEVLDVECTIKDKQVDIHFLESELNKEILSEESVEYSVFCFLKEGKTIDEELFQMKIDSLHAGWIISDRSSGLSPNFAGNLVGTEFTLEVEAKEMLFQTVPESVNYQEQFTVVVQLVDSLGNIDTNSEFEIELSLASGNGGLSSENLKLTSEDGDFLWEDLIYSEAEKFTLQAECDNFPTILSDNISGVDKTSVIASASPILAKPLSSLAITQDDAISVLNFKISDLATHDQLPTIISNLKFYNKYPEHSFSWAKHISGAVLLSKGEMITAASNISDNRIEFNSSKGVLELPNNSEMNLSLAIFFRKGQLPDNATFQVEIPKFHEWKCLESGSKIQPILPDDIISEIHFINVEASQLSFSSYPFGINNSDEKFSLKIGACDYFKSIDKDAIGAVNLSLLDGNGELIVMDEKLELVNGIVDCDSIQYNGTEDFSLKIESSLASDSIQILLGEDELAIDENFESKSIENWINTKDWCVSSYRPIAGEYSLKHNLSEELGSSCICTPLKGFNPKASAINWRFIVQNGDWDPSSGNKFVFHLLMDDSDLSAATTKYSVGVNQSGSNDILSLCTLNKDQKLKVLLESEFNWNENEAVAIQITYYPNGLLRMEYNRLGKKENWIVVGEIHSEIVSDAKEWFSGLDFTYETASRAGNLWFDDLEIKSINTPPFFKSYEILATDSLLLEYSEKLDFSKSAEIENFKLTRTNGEYLGMKVLPGVEDNCLLLVLDDELKTGSYLLDLYNITDAKGEVQEKESINFGYFAPAKSNDLVINEIMVDETPSVGLPEYEFIELYNSSEYPISIENWILKAGEKETVLAADTIPAKAYLILCSNSAVEEFTSFGDVLGVSSFPGLTNSGGTIEIQSAEKIVVDQVSYFDLWYKSDEKSNGGWSFERIDPLNACSTNGNWSASKSETGGTPGKENSIHGNNIDNLAPAVSHLRVLSKNHLSIELSEQIDTFSLLSFQNYSLADNPVSTITVETPMIVHLEFANSFEDGHEQQLNITSLQDECGNVLDTVVSFIWYEVHSNDVVINEIMVDETPSVGLPEYEFIELYNSSEYPISIENWILKAGEKETVLAADTIPAKAYLILCSNSAVEEFTSFGDVLGVSSFPGLTNSGGTIEIQSAEKIVIDQVSYFDSWYKSDEKSNGGWSFERIDPLNACSTNGNWSASKSETGGTPGKENSIHGNNIDNLAPAVSHLRVLSKNHLSIELSEQIDTFSLLSFQNYSLADNPVSTITVETPMIVHLEFANSFEDGHEQQLNITSLQDECGNVLDTVVGFIWYEVHSNDVVINEIMVDETPSVGLPEYEFIELYNSSEYPISIENWILKAGEKETVLAADTIPAKAYLILCSNSAVEEFTSFGDVLGVSSFPGLTNSGGTIEIQSAEKIVIDQVSYSDSWYKSDEKSNGGWSLERIDPANTSWQANNWKASENELGGTPGKVNSIYSVNQDLIAPGIESCRCISSNCLKLVFSEPIENRGLVLSNFQLSPDLVYPKEVIQSDLAGKEFQLIFNEDFVRNSQCQLILSDEIKDLAGNSMITKEFEFWVPGIVTKDDLVINEVLFNPYPDGSDYVEIVNVSEKVIDLSSIKLAARTDNFELDNEVSISDKYLLPNEYILVTEDTLNVQQNYFTSNPDVFCQVKSLPSFSDDAGRVVLISNNELIDDFAYNENMHFELLASVEGVSLERINPKGETNSKSNWQSAAQNIGFGTPGIQNSVYNDLSSSNSEISLSPKIFTPDNDGFDDRLLITFNLEMDGYLATVRIYNSMGIEIRKLANNLNLANEDSLFWDGLTSQKERASIGIYLVYIELFSPDGKRKIFKESCVLGGKFN